MTQASPRAIQLREVARARRYYAASVLPTYAEQAKAKLYALLMNGDSEAPESLLDALVPLERETLAATLEPLLETVRARMNQDETFRARLKPVMMTRNPALDLNTVLLILHLSSSPKNNASMMKDHLEGTDRRNLSTAILAGLDAKKHSRSFTLRRAVIAIIEFVLSFDYTLELLESGNLSQQDIFKANRVKKAIDFDRMMPVYLDLLDILLEVQQESSAAAV